MTGNDLEPIREPDRGSDYRLLPIDAGAELVGVGAALLAVMVAAGLLVLLGVWKP